MKRKQLREILFITVVCLSITAIFSKALAEGVDKSIDVREAMLCNSARVSGNIGYIGSCK